MYHLFVYLLILLTQDRLRCAALFDDCCWLRFMADDVAPVHSVLLGGAVATELCLCFSTGSHSSSYLAGTSATNSVVPPCRHEVTARLIFLISRAISTLLLLLAASDAATRSIWRCYSQHLEYLGPEIRCSSLVRAGKALEC